VDPVAVPRVRHARRAGARSDLDRAAAAGGLPHALRRAGRLVRLRRAAGALERVRGVLLLRGRVLRHTAAQRARRHEHARQRARGRGLQLLRARRAPLLRANVPGEGVLAAGHQQREGQAAARGRSADAGGLEELPAGRAGAVAAAPAAQRRHARGFRRPAAAPSRRRRARPWGSCRRPRVQRCRPCRVHCRLL
ncbi:unnamed protein product, partial [Prorocentrum cordatum]